VTAASLLAALTAGGCRPTAEGEELVFHRPPPAHLHDPLAVLHTGVRALVTGRRWFGLDPATGKPCGPHPARGDGPLAFGALDPARPLPAGVGLLSVEGDACWDRLPPLARLNSPDLFATGVAPHSRTP
jgi:hypothetical protein